jgi:polysaccharide export outer membrane protein
MRLKSVRHYVLTFVWAQVVLILASAAVVRAQEYTIGPRDVLKIVVWAQDDLSKDYPVDADGFVAFPLLGRVKTSGLTTKQLAAHLTELLEKDYLVNPQVLVSVKDYLSRKVNILGEAEKPGVYYLSGEMTLLDVLSKAGALSKLSGKQILLVRNHSASGVAGSGNSIRRLNLEKLQAGDASENIQLENDDTIFIPKGQAFFVVGEVKKGGTFPLDKEITAFEAVSLAEGFSDKAARAAIKVVRRTNDGRQETISLDLSGTVPKDRDFKLIDGDTLLIPRGNTFFVFGQVKSPGAYLLDKEMNILEGITIAGGFTEKAAPGRTRVIRNTPKGQEVLNIDMNDIIKRGQRDKAIRLHESDVVVVPESFF